MKKWTLIVPVLIIVLFLIYGFYSNWYSIGGSCTEEAKICPDGTSVGRQGFFCLFEKCPNPVYCNSNSQCARDMKCISFPEKEKSYCANEFYWTIGLRNVCYRDCGSFDGCELIESDPLKIVCK